MFNANPFKLSAFLGFSKHTNTAEKKDSLLPASDFESLASECHSFAFNGDLTARRIRAALEEGRLGTVAEQTGLIDEMLEREPQIAAHLQTRTLAVSGKGWSITSKQFPDIAENAQKMLALANLQPLIAHLCSAILFGYAGAVCDWETGGKRLVGFNLIRPGSLGFESNGDPLVMDVRGEFHRLDCFAPAQFVFAVSPGGTGLPSRNGLGRTLLWLWLMKKVGLNGWARFVEKYGMPLLLGKLPAGAGRNQVNELLGALMKMSREGIGVATGSESGIETVECAKSGGDQEKFCRYADEMMTLVILGQLATSATASGMSNGDIQGRVRQDLIASDASFVINTIQNQVLNPWIQMVYGIKPEEHDVTFWIEFSPPKDLISKAELCLKITAATGCQLDKAWAEEQFGIRLV